MTLSTSATTAAFSGLDSARVYAQGIASGDPYQDSVILWTHINPPAGLKDSLAVNWEVATTADFKPGSQVASGSFQTDASRDWTVKVEAKGLKSGQDYYYRFNVGDVVSPIGQTRTLASSTDAVHLAVFSCANYTAVPEFLAYGRAATIDASRPYDAALFLGDYIYEYAKDGYAAAEDAVQVRGFSPNHELITLADYRERYAQYSTDPGLLALRASVPTIAIWDDHETANDSWKGGAENHQPATEGAWADRESAALQAFYEWIPIREPSQRQGLDAGQASTPLAQGYRSFTFGDVLSLHMLETRLLARDKQLAYPDAAAVQTRIGAILADPALTASYAKKFSIAPPSGPTDAAGIQAFAKGLSTPVTTELVQATVAAAYGDPNRAMVGSTELSWLQQQMASSQATWQVLGQQVLMMNVAVPAELLLNPGDATLLAKYAQPLQKLANGTKFSDLNPSEQALFSESTKIPYNLDAWDGYGADRERILQSALTLGKKLVSLAGDTHNAWAGDLTTMSPSNAGTLAGLEFGTPGVSSPGFEKYLPGADTYLRTAFAPVDGLDAIFESYVKDVSYADLNHRGFLDITFTRSKIQADFELIDSYDPITGLPIWRSEELSANAAMKLSAVSSNLTAPLPIIWQTGWQELDLQTGVVISNDGKVTALDPADYGVLPTSAVLLPKVGVQGSKDPDVIDAASGSRIDAGGGNDLIRSEITGSRGDNTIFGGAGADTFVLGAAGDKVYGGLSSNDPTGSVLDGETNTYIIDLDTLHYDGTPNGVVSLMDFQVGRDRLQLILPGGAISEVVVDSSNYANRKSELLSQGVLISRSIANTTTNSDGSVALEVNGQKLELRPESGCSISNCNLSDIDPEKKKLIEQKGVTVNQTQLSFTLNAEKRKDKDNNIVYAPTASVYVPLSAVSGNLSVTQNTSLAYYVSNKNGDFVPFTYDPTKGQGARFFDTDSNGIADFISMKYIDNGEFDRDGEKNGSVLDPGAAATATINASLSASGQTLLVRDAAKADAKVAVNLKATLGTLAATANEIGYIVLNDGEAVTSSTPIDRAQVLFSSIQNGDVPDLSRFSFQRQFSLVNGQSLRFFEISNSTLSALAAGKTSFDGLGSSFQWLSSTLAGGIATFRSASGINFNLQLSGEALGLSQLLAQEQANAPLLDFTGMGGRTLSGTYFTSREASYNSTLSFYRVLDVLGTVKDAATGISYVPGDSNYAAIAKANTVSSLSNLSVANRQMGSGKITLNETNYLAPMAVVNGSDTFFAYAAANSDGLAHFRSLGDNIIGLEDMRGGGDRDYDDMIIQIAPTTLA